MSRLDSFIRRMQAQRTCLDWAAAEIAHMPGPVVELGLGNGRTYDHLRQRLPGRTILVFDLRLAAHPNCLPPDELLYLGEAAETLPRAIERYGGQVALIHYDLGTGVEARNAALAEKLAPSLAALMRPGGVVVADFPIPARGWTALPLPEGVKPGRYFIYRAQETARAAPLHGRMSKSTITGT